MELDGLRGLEGLGATAYFGVFDHLLLRRKEDFYFHGRNRRPPLDRVNAMLSFAYSLLAHDWRQRAGKCGDWIPTLVFSIETVREGLRWRWT